MERIVGKKRLAVLLIILLALSGSVGWYYATNKPAKSSSPAAFRAGPCTFMIYHNGSMVSAQNCLTGKIDSSEAASLVVQDAINAMLAKGGRLVFGPGTYFLSGISLPSPHNLELQGESGSILETSPGSAANIFIISGRVSNLTFDNLIIDGNMGNIPDGATRDADTPIFCNAVVAGRNITFRNVEVQNVRSGTGIKLVNSVNVWVINSTFHDLGDTANTSFTADGWFSNNVTDLHFAQSKFYRMTDVGIDAGGGSYLEVGPGNIFNVTFGAGISGVLAESGGRNLTNLRFHNNEFIVSSSGTNYALKIANTLTTKGSISDVKVSDNTFAITPGGAANIGILIYPDAATPFSNFQISGNTFSTTNSSGANYGIGIYFSDNATSNIAIIDNDVQGLGLFIESVQNLRIPVYIIGNELQTVSSNPFTGTPPSGSVIEFNSPYSALGSLLALGPGQDIGWTPISAIARTLDARTTLGVN